MNSPISSNSLETVPDSERDTQKLRLRVMVPHEGLEAFRDAISCLRRDWSITRNLAWRMFLRDTRAAYRQSFLGYIWLLLPCLANTLVWIFLNSQNVVQIAGGTAPYPLFVFVGNLLWTAFNSSLVGTMAIIDEARGTLAKVNFPHEALVLSAIGKALLTVVATSVFLVPFLIMYPVTPQWQICLFPIGILASMLLGASLGLFVVPFAALFNDLGRAIHLGLRFVFFLTPVIFVVPASGWGRTLMLMNPATPVIVTTRSWLLGGEVPMLTATILVIGSSSLLLAIGVVMLKVTMPHLIERLSD